MKRTVIVRSMDWELWKRARQEAIKRETTVGVLLAQALREWLERNEGRGDASNAE